MAGTSNRNVQISFSGVVESSIIQAALENPDSPASPAFFDLSSGDNDITIPIFGSIIATAVTLIPPPANTVAIILKGDDADVGIPLHLTDPSSIALDPSATRIVINVAADLAGFLIIFS